MRATSVLRQARLLITGAWVAVLAVFATAWAALAQTSGHQNVPGDVYLWELARRASAGVPVPTGSDVHLYELAQRVEETVPVPAGFDWTTVLVAFGIAVIVLAAVMVVVTTRRHPTPHVPMGHGRV